MKIKIEENDSPEVKAAKQALIDLYNDTMAEAKKLFKSVDSKDFDPTTDEGKAAIKAIVDGEKAEVKVKIGEKEMSIADAFKAVIEQCDKLSTKLNKPSSEP